MFNPFFRILFIIIIFISVFVLGISSCSGGGGGSGRTPPVGPVPIDISLTVASTRADIVDANAESGIGEFGQGNVPRIGSGNSEITKIERISLEGGTLLLASNSQSLQTQQANLEVDFEMWIAAGEAAHKNDPSVIAVGNPAITWTAKAQSVSGSNSIFDFSQTIENFQAAANNVLDPVINGNYTAFVRFTLNGSGESFALSLEQLKLTLEASKDLEDETLIEPESSSSSSAPQIIGFEAIPSNILQPGESTNLHWWISGGKSPLTLTIDNGVGDITNLIQKEVSPTETTVYTLTVTDANQNQATKTVEILVGDSPSNVEQLIELLRKGGRVDIKAGRYVLTDPLTLDNDVELIGEGSDNTFIVSSTGDNVLKFQGPAKFTASGISFEHTGNSAANVIDVADGEINFSNCNFIGTANTTGGGVGLWLTGSTTGVVKNSSIKNNRLGIQINNEAKPNLEGNTIRNNKEIGISYFENAGGTAIGNRVENNEGIGISVEGSASPRLEQNIVRNNRVSEEIGTGIAYYNNTNTGGIAIKNTIEGSYDGIAVEGVATPRLEGNLLKDNNRYGIIIVVPASPELVDNEFIGNKFGRVYIFDPSK